MKNILNKMKRYSSVLVLLLSLIAFNMKAQDKPNVLFILADDFGFHDLGITGSKIYQTPNIDEIAEEGIFFQNGYTNYPRCVPSRYAFMTGQYPVNEDKGNLKANVANDQNFIKILNDAGYTTSYVGKWHLGELENNNGKGNDPKGFGFQKSYAAGGAGGVDTRFFPFNTKSKEKGSRKDPVPNVEEDGKQGDYLADMLTNKTMQYIKESADGKEPFFAMIAYYAVHTPLEAKDPDKERNKKEIEAFDYGDTPEYIKEGEGRRKMRQDDPDYAGMVENVDENVGKLMELLDELDLEENTIVIFASDHGGLSNDGYKRERHLATTNNPLRAGKGWLYEGGIRIPYFIKWDEHFEPRKDERSIVMAMDLMPTVIDYTVGATAPDIDGKSLRPVIEGTQVWDDRTVFWHERKARPHSTGEYEASAVRSGDYKFIDFYKKDRKELYNLKEDVGEEHNLFEKEPEKAKELMKKLKDWKKKYLVPEKLDRRKEKV